MAKIIINGTPVIVRADLITPGEVVRRAFPWMKPSLKPWKCSVTFRRPNEPEVRRPFQTGMYLMVEDGMQFNVV